ncbi:unnamed protein product [Durusdinium trenchii]|uniref:Uncharacterized protein n=1 Tax=Durusdinium trenchii TaxID=1381693 RepID=A0ABP0PEL3_9DINO
MECLGPFARRAVTAAIRKTTGGNFIVNTIKLKSLWDQFVSLGCLSRRKRFAEFLTTTAKQFAMAQVENCDVKDTTTFHVNVVYVLMFDCGFHVALQEWETFLNDIKPELAESSSSIAPSTSDLALWQRIQSEVGPDEHQYTWAASYNMIVHKNLQEENSIYPTDQFLKVKDNFHIAISQIFVKKALESEECRTLQKPTATFLKQCAKSGLSHEADKADKPASFEASKEDSSNSSSSSVEKDNEHTTNNQPADEDQIFGLNLLAEEAEAISGQPESDSELDNDKSSDDPSLHLLCKGLAATFHPTEFNDDDAVEARVSEVMNSEVQSHVADTHERTIAFESVKNNNCDNLLNQEQMNQLQNPDMDFIDAAVETCVTLVKIGLLPVRQAFSFCWSSVHMKASNVNMLLKEATEAVEEVVEEMMVEVVVMEVGLMLVGTMVLKVEMLLQTILLLTLMLMMADPMMKTMSQMVLQNQM